jgi:hypothetical protein
MRPGASKQRLLVARLKSLCICDVHLACDLP